jgi:DHA1 family tetracycline resistance protein-like MFS transporter
MSAFIADLTPEAQRARRYGQLGACFGVGFIIGPLLGAGWATAGCGRHSWRRRP